MTHLRLLLFKLITPSNARSLVISIVLQKHYFHDICTFSKNNYNKTFNFTRSCAYTQKAKFCALHVLKKITHSKAPTWQY